MVDFCEIKKKGVKLDCYLAPGSNTIIHAYPVDLCRNIVPSGIERIYFFMHSVKYHSYIVDLPRSMSFINENIFFCEYYCEYYIQEVLCTKGTLFRIFPKRIYVGISNAREIIRNKLNALVEKGQIPRKVAKVLSQKVGRHTIVPVRFINTDGKDCTPSGEVFDFEDVSHQPEPLLANPQSIQETLLGMSINQTLFFDSFSYSFVPVDVMKKLNDTGLGTWDANFTRGRSLYFITRRA